MKKDQRLKIEYVPIEKLKIFDRNPRKEKKGGINKLVESHKKFGWTNPILVQKSNGIIIAGHKRLVMAKRRGVKMAPVIYLDMNDKDAILYNIADNKLPEEISTWDKKLLASLYMDLGEGYKDAKVTGINEKEFSDLLDKFGTQNVIDLTKNPGEKMNMDEKTYFPFWLVVRGDVDYFKEVRKVIEQTLKKVKTELVINDSEQIFE